MLSMFMSIIDSVYVIVRVVMDKIGSLVLY